MKRIILEYKGDKKIYETHGKITFKEWMYGNLPNFLEDPNVTIYVSRRYGHQGFEIEIEIEGTQYNFTYDKVLRGQQTIDVAEIEYSKKNGFKVTSKLESRTASKQIWNVATQTLVPVTMIMNSPNHWDGEQTGNKHWFFIMKDCLKPEPARGFFNEFLKNDLDQHRKVFEMLGNKMKTPESTQQLSGLGFSSTVRNQLVVKVDGAFSRTLKVNF